MNRSRHPILLLLPFLFLSACGNQETKPPSYVIPEERFKKVLVDLYILQGEADHRKAAYGKDPQKILPKGTAKILKEHDLKRKNFERSYRYYMKDPERMERIHNEVLKELRRRKGKKGIEGKEKEKE